MSNKGKGRGRPKPPKFTVQELMTLHGLTVEQALAKGFEVVEHKAVCNDLKQERVSDIANAKKEDKSNGNQLQRETYQ